MSSGPCPCLGRHPCTPGSGRCEATGAWEVPCCSPRTEPPSGRSPAAAPVAWASAVRAAVSPGWVPPAPRWLSRQADPAGRPVALGLAGAAGGAAGRPPSAFLPPPVALPFLFRARQPCAPGGIRGAGADPHTCAHTHDSSPPPSRRPRAPPCVPPLLALRRGAHGAARGAQDARARARGWLTAWAARTGLRPAGDSPGTDSAA